MNNFNFGRMLADTYKYNLNNEQSETQKIGFKLERTLMKKFIKVVVNEKGKELSTVLRKLSVFFLEDKTNEINYNVSIPHSTTACMFYIRKDVRNEIITRCKSINVSVANVMRILIKSYIANANDPNSVFYNF